MLDTANVKGCNAREMLKVKTNRNNYNHREIKNKLYFLKTTSERHALSIFPIDFEEVIFISFHLNRTEMAITMLFREECSN